MRRLIVAFAAFVLAAATATASVAAPQLVYKVDRVTAAIVRGHLIVTAEGAVNSGGWTLPRLHYNPFHVPESASEVLEFQANPPLDNAVVIQALVPIVMTSVFPLPHYGVTQVTVVSATNNITVPIRMQ
jgi:hypothetical protein